MIAAVGWILGALIASVAIWLFALFVSGTIKTDQTVSRIVFGLITSLLAVLLVAMLSRRQKSGPSLGFYSFAKKLLIGMAWYAIPAVSGLFLASILGVVEVSVDGSFMDAVSAVLLVAILVFLSEALPEEIIFRGYILKKLSIFNNRWLVIILQAAIFTIFAFMIGAIGGILDASFIFTFGIVLGVLRSATGSLAAPIGFHLACMTVQQSFSSQWSPFVVSNESILQTFILGMIPISVALAYYATRISRVNSDSRL